MKKNLVTGGGGFIGSHLVKALLDRGEQVVVLDNFISGNKPNLNEFINDIELIEGDLTDYGLIKKALNDVKVVFHHGAISSVPKSVKRPIQSNNVNVTGTLKLLFASVENKVDRFIFASSSAVYGNAPAMPKREDMTTSPESPYAVNKLAGELYCSVFYKLFGLETVSLRYFNVFGPKQDPHSEYAAVIPKFITDMIKDRVPTIYGDGEQSRDFIYIDNVVSANLLAAEAKRLQGESLNIGSGKSVSLNELVTSINTLIGKNIEPNYSGAREGDVRSSLADITKAFEMIGYVPKVSFVEGLEKTINWHKKR